MQKLKDVQVVKQTTTQAAIEAMQKIAGTKAEAGGIPRSEEASTVLKLGRAILKQTTFHLTTT